MQKPEPLQLLPPPLTKDQDRAFNHAAQSNGAAPAVAEDPKAKCRADSGYRIVIAPSLVELVANVNFWIEGGFEPLGAPFMTVEQPKTQVMPKPAPIVIWHQCVWKKPPGFYGKFSERRKHQNGKVNG